MACAAAHCGPLEQLPGWNGLSDQARAAAASAARDVSADNGVPTTIENEVPPLILPRDVVAPPPAPAAPDLPAALQLTTPKKLQNMDFWDAIPWNHLH